MKRKLKLRRKTLKQWASFGSRGLRKRKYKDNRALHEHEHKIILRDAIAHGREFTAATLAAKHPYYDQAMLPTALKRMRQAGLLESTGNWGRNPMYTVKIKTARAAA